jgi:hypothetical protein
MILLGSGSSPELLWVVLLALGVPSALLCVVLWVVLNSVVTRAELTGDLGRTLELRELWAYARATYKRQILHHIVFSVVAFGVVLLGMAACFVGIYPATELATKVRQVLDKKVNRK